MIDLTELLFARGLPKENCPTKLIRHQSGDWDLPKLITQNQIHLYQANQARRVFNCRFIASFIGLNYSQALFIGVYEVKGVIDDETKKWSPEYVYQDMKPGRFWYDLEKKSGFEDMEGRVVIDWGQSTRMWHQWISPREIVEIYPKGYVREFPGFDDVVLGYRELQNIISNPLPNREWHRALQSVAGVYLITDTLSGKQYIGSASGADGIWGRWNAYAETGHGGNKLLTELLDANPDAAFHFQFSILRALPRTLTKDEIIESEKCYKLKLGSRAHGLNAN